MTARPQQSVLRVHAIHRDVPFTAEMSAAVDGEMATPACWLGLETAS